MMYTDAANGGESCNVCTQLLYNDPGSEQAVADAHGPFCDPSHHDLCRTFGAAIPFGSNGLSFTRIGIKDPLISSLKHPCVRVGKYLGSHT